MSSETVLNFFMLLKIQLQRKCKDDIIVLKLFHRHFSSLSSLINTKLLKPCLVLQGIKNKCNILTKNLNYHTKYYFFTKYNFFQRQSFSLVTSLCRLLCSGDAILAFTLSKYYAGLLCALFCSNVSNVPSIEIEKNAYMKKVKACFLSRSSLQIVKKFSQL